MVVVGYVPPLARVSILKTTVWAVGALYRSGFGQMSAKA
jgi:hypothetical protein